TRPPLLRVGKDWTRGGNRSSLPPRMGALAYGGAEHLASMVVETPPAYGRGERRLLDRVRTAVRTRHMSRRTEQAYVFWIRRYILFHDKRQPAALGAEEVTRFLSHLAEHRRVSASTQSSGSLPRRSLESSCFWYLHRFCTSSMKVGKARRFSISRLLRYLPWPALWSAISLRPRRSAHCRGA